MSPNSALDTSELCTLLARELYALAIEVDLASVELRPRLASAEGIRDRSFGPVEKPETLNYRTKKPERGGLFCARIFGPVDDDSCICTKYVGSEQRGVICEKCGVAVLPAAVRRERWGHLELAAPVVHPLFAAEVARLLGITREALDQLVSGQASFDSDGQLRPAEDLDPTQIGGEAIRAALRERAPEGLRFMLEVLPVLPAGLRPLEIQADGKVVTSDVNDLYRRAVNRNNRLRRLIELNAPRVILHNEFRMLQATVEQLCDNAHTPKPLEFRGRTLRSLGDLVASRFAELEGRVEVSAEGWFGAALASPEPLARVAEAVGSQASQLLDAPLCASAPLASSDAASLGATADGDSEEDEYDF